jgi:hypothetical protein
VGDSFSQLPRDKKRGLKKSEFFGFFSQQVHKLFVPIDETRGCKKSGYLVWKTSLGENGVSISYQTLKISISRDEKKGCKESGSLVWKSTLRGRSGFLLVAGALFVPRDEKKRCKKSEFFVLETNC